MRARLGVFVAVAAVTVAACGGDGADGQGNDTAAGNGEERTIRYVGGQYSEQTEAFWLDLAAEFEAVNDGIQVEIEIVPFADLDQRINTLIQTGQQPDILSLNRFVGYAADGLLLPAADIVGSETLADFVPAFAERSTFDGELYALPFIASSRLLFYNTDLFEEASLSDPPTSWAEVEEYAGQITETTGKVGIGLPFGPQEAHAEFQMWTMNNGGGYVDDNENWAVNSGANLETMEFLRHLTDEGLTQPNPGTTDRNDVFNLFAAGEIGMVNGHIVLPGQVIDEQNPDLNYGVAPLPSADGTPGKTLGVQDYLMAFDNDGNAEAVHKFLDFFYADENYETFLMNETFLPTVESSQAFSDDPVLRPFVEALPDAAFYPSTLEEWSDVQGAIQQQIGTVFQGSDPATVLTSIQEIGAGS